MRYLFPVITAMLMFVACNKRNPQIQNSLPDVDTVLFVDTITDSCDLLRVPVAADELFDDFIFDFMHNADFQSSRICFPLPELSVGANRQIQRKDWKYDNLYADDDVFTMLFDNEAAIANEKDTLLDRVLVENVDLDGEILRTYDFRRLKGIWMLSSVGESPLSASGNGEFYAFYKQFVTDSLFQQKHVQKTFQFRTYDLDSSEGMNGTLDRNQWLVFRPEMPAHKFSNVCYAPNSRDSRMRVLVLGSLSGGMNCCLKFERQNDDWCLTYLEN